MAGALDPIPNLPHAPQPPESSSEDVRQWRRAQEMLMSQLGRWPRAGYGFFNREPTVNDDQTFGYERGFIWVANVIAEESLG